MKVTSNPDAEVERNERAELRDDQERFTITEGEVLLHHASETLLRLYIAHESIPPCPWLEIARERHFAEFKRRVSKRFLENSLSEDERRSKLVPIFHGTNERERLEPTPSLEDWNASLDNIECFLQHFARVFLEPGAYNAAKHGLALSAGESGMELLGIPELTKKGPAIEYLSARKAEDRDRWALHTRWVDIGRSLALHMAARLIQGLWEIAAWRYADRKPERGLLLYGQPRYEEMLSKEPVQVGTVTMDLLYYRTDSAPA